MSLQNSDIDLQYLYLQQMALFYILLSTCFNTLEKETL